MIDTLQQFVRSVDSVLARAYLSMFQEHGGLINLLFHSLFRDEREIDLNHIDPLQRTTVGQFSDVIEYYLQHDYKFVGPDDLLEGLDPSGRYVQLTFDDGYYNNVLALPVLKEFDVPALFFISTDNVQMNKCFWWDVLYRERLTRGASRQQIYNEALALKQLRTDQIEEQLSRRFGPDALLPRGDIDRPFTPRELANFAQTPHVIIGNHTANHAILTNYDAHEMRIQICSAQAAIGDITGKTPTAIAYPNGTYNAQVIEACRAAGLKLGYTIRPEKVRIPAADPFRLGRFVPCGSVPITSQSRTYRSDISIYRTMRHVYLQAYRSGISA